MVSQCREGTAAGTEGSQLREPQQQGENRDPGRDPGTKGKMASHHDVETRNSSGSPSKAMKLLGLSKLPQGASGSENPMFGSQRGLERAKSTSPVSLYRGAPPPSRPDSFREAGAARQNNRSSSIEEGERNSYDVVEGRGKPGAANHPEGGGYEQYSDEHVGGIDVGANVDEGEKGMTSYHRRNNSEWLDMREASLKLRPTDLDDQFLAMMTDLMNLFPEPPSRDSSAGSVTESTSPTAASSGRSRGENARRGLHMPRTGNQRRIVNGMGGGAWGRADFIQSRQNPLFQQYMDGRGAGEGEGSEFVVPIRISYSKPEDVFSL